MEKIHVVLYILWLIHMFAKAIANPKEALIIATPFP